MQITQVKLDTVYDVPSEMKYHHKMTEKEVAFADGWNAYRNRMLGLESLPTKFKVLFNTAVINADYEDSL